MFLQKISFSKMSTDAQKIQSPLLLDRIQDLQARAFVNLLEKDAHHLLHLAQKTLTLQSVEKDPQN